MEDRKMGGWERNKRFRFIILLSSHLPILLFTYLPILLLSSCYENREGCLDSRATNFGIDADRECDNCCTFPQLKLVFEHKLLKDNAANLTYTDTIYKDDFDNEFRVKDIQFYVSNARLVRANGTEVYPTDSLNVNIQPPGSAAQAVKISNNVGLVNRNDFTALEMGTFITSGDFMKVRFNIGLNQILNQVIPTSLPDSVVNHPLENTAMYISADSGFLFNRLQLFNNPTKTDTTFRTIRIFQPDSVQVELPFLGGINILEGFNVRITLRINYLEWFKGINLKTDPPAMLATKISGNLRNSLTVTRVELQ